MEQSRLELLKSYEILDTEAEEKFDRLTQLVARICETPIATITFVDEVRQWFKSTVGLSLRQTDRNVAFCDHAIEGSELFIVPDAKKSPLFAGNPLVTGTPNIRFYAGMPLVTPEGLSIGTLSVMDHVPRTLSPVQLETLQVIAEQVMAQLELRRQQHAREVQHKERESKNAALLQIASRVSRLGGWEISLPDSKISWSDNLYEILGVEPSHTPTLEEAINFLAPGSREKILAVIEACKSFGTPYDEEVELITAKGERIWARSIGLPIRDKTGAIIGLQGAFQDISESKRRDEALATSEQRFRELADSMPYIVWSANPDGSIDYGNRAVNEYAGMTQMGDLNQEWENLLHPDDLERAVSSWIDAVSAGTVYSCEYRLLRGSDKSYRWHLGKGMPIRDEAGSIVKWYGTVIDIHDSKLASEQIGRLSFYDPLTQLPNRRFLRERLSRAVSLNSQNGYAGAVILIDLDNFKTLNEAHGQDMGDLLLKQVAARLMSFTKANDMVARLGEDEFAILLENLGQNEEEVAAQANEASQKILRGINSIYDLEGHEHHITGSMGVAFFGGARHNDITGVLKHAALAVSQAKATGKNTVCFFEPKFQAAALMRASLESDLHKGLQKSEFLLYYQPQLNDAGRITGVEALVRWRHPERGMVSPAEFIPLVENNGLILPLGRWILEQACTQLAQWKAQAETASLTISINVSARQFRHPDFTSDVLSILTKTGAPAQRLKIELTESVVLDEVEKVIEKINMLKEHGIAFSLDDFGTGYSSLAYLKRLPIDQLKIDPSFVRSALENPKDAAIVSTIINLGQTMGMDIVAEGVETIQQKSFLSHHGCRNYQGYLFSPPLPIEKLVEFVLGHHKFPEQKGA